MNKTMTRAALFASATEALRAEHLGLPHGFSRDVDTADGIVARTDTADGARRMVAVLVDAGFRASWSKDDDGDIWLWIAPSEGGEVE